jgi:ferredoxin
VAGVRLVPVQRVYDEAGRFAPVVLDGPEETLACDAVIFAIGQRADASWLPASLGLGAAPWGGVPTDRATLRTAHPRVWCGGDLAFGPRNLIDAIADGQRAARDIVAALAGGARSAAERSPAVFRPPPVRRDTPPRQHRWASGYDRIPRAPLPVLPAQARGAVDEVEGVLDEAAARREGARCLRCFENLELDAERCVLCGLCADVCPTACLRIAAAGVDASGAPTSALVLDETACLRCGLCVDRCPADALELVHAQELLDVGCAGGAA